MHWRVGLAKSNTIPHLQTSEGPRQASLRLKKARKLFASQGGQVFDAAAAFEINGSWFLFAPQHRLGGVVEDIRSYLVFSYL